MLTQQTPLATAAASQITILEDVQIVELMAAEFFKLFPRVLTCLKEAGCNPVLLTQHQAELGLSLALNTASYDQAIMALEAEFSEEIQQRALVLQQNPATSTLITVLGASMRGRPGVAARVFQTLARNGVNIQIISQRSSEESIAFIVSRSDSEKALVAVEGACLPSTLTRINLFLTGLGTVGGALIELLLQESKNLFHQGFDVRVIGIANTKSSVVEKSGLDLSAWKEKIRLDGKSTSYQQYADILRTIGLPNIIFVDCTASAELPEVYIPLLEQSISVVTANKKGNAGPLQHYRALHDAANQSNAQFFFETNVGAALPVIGTLQDLKASGDVILEVEAVLSGTLSYIFNSLSSSSKFSEIVRKARSLGLTEPDPREDLSGIDVARKLLILARELGHNLELSMIKVESLIPPQISAAELSVDEFLVALAEHDTAFQAVIREAEAAGEKLCYVGSISDAGVQVKIKRIDATHPFYFLSGADNSVSFRTHRYAERPLVVQGPGAGGALTASGVLADILRAARYMV